MTRAIGDVAVGGCSRAAWLASCVVQHSRPATVGVSLCGKVLARDRVTMHVSIIVTEDDEVCWRCKLLRLALILVLLRPHVCLRCCNEIVRTLSHHARRGHLAPGLRTGSPPCFPVAALSTRRENTIEFL